MTREWLSYALPVIGLIAFVSSWVLSFITQWLAKKTNAIDLPTGGRKIHTTPTPLLGGLGIGTIVIFLSTVWGWYYQIDLRFLISFIIGCIILMLGGFIDDKWTISAKWQFLWVVAACASVVLGGLTIAHVTNPFGGVWHANTAYWLPSLFAFCWLVLVTFATKLMDGIDGLVSGQTVIGSSLIVALALTQKYFQPSIAVFSVFVGAAFAGFLLHNRYPAKQFLGESGSTLAGFLLGVMAILGGAKLATALMVLSLPMIDLVLVAFGRLRRGVSPFKGDDTHLHHKLLKAGFDKPFIVFMLWSLTATFGAAGLFVQTRGKVLLLLLLCAITAGLSYWSGHRAQQKV